MADEGIITQPTLPTIYEKQVSWDDNLTVSYEPSENEGESDSENEKNEEKQSHSFVITFEKSKNILMIQLDQYKGEGDLDFLERFVDYGNEIIAENPDLMGEDDDFADIDIF